MATSIRRRLLFMLLLTIASISSVTLVLSYFDARHEVQELFDAQLAQSARVLQVLLLPELLQGRQSELQSLLQLPGGLSHPHFGSDVEEAGPYGHEYERKLAFQVWDDRQNLVLQSASAPQTALSQTGLHPANRGYIDERIGDEDWRVFNLWDEQDRFLIQVAERYDVRNELITDISNRLILPALLSLPILAVVIWMGVGRGLAPVQQVAHEMTRRDPQNLQSMDVGPVPQEVEPLVNELNNLFSQVRDALEKERRFTDDAAHELRTPLASLKTQVQVALRSTDHNEKRRALQNVIISVNRANHLIDQMLTLARLNPQGGEIKRENICLHALTAEVVAQIAPKALKKHINIELSGDERSTVKGDEISFSILIRNLVDNAVQYTPGNGQVSVVISSELQHATLTITDSGPGIDAELQKRVFDRFFRVVGNNAPGCGLGLAIVKHIAYLYDIDVQIKNKTNGDGLVVNVVFPKN